MSSPSGKIRILLLVVRTLLAALALFWFAFALLSGSDQYGQGIGAVLRNLPNALPWLALFAFVYIAFRWELVGGILVVLAGLASMVFFNAWTAPIVLFGVALPLIAAGAALIAFDYLDRSET